MAKTLKSIFAIAFLALVLSCSGPETISNQPPTSVVVVAALDSMYWLQMKNVYSKEKLDHLNEHPDAIRSVEEDLGIELTPEAIQIIVEKRKNSDTYDY